MDKIKIAYVIDRIESPTAGTEKQLLLLIQHLDKDKYEPYLFCLQDSEWLANEFSLCAHRVLNISSFKKPKDFIKIIQFARYLKREKFEIIQTQFRDSNIVGTIAARMANLKAIISTRRNQGYWHNRFELVLLKFLNRMTSIFVTNAESTKNFTVEVEGVLPDKIEVIYNGIDIDKFLCNGEGNQSEYRSRYDISADQTVVGILANLRPVKGLHTFLQAASIVADKYPGTKFLIAGDGPERAGLEKLAGELNLQKNVVFLGSITSVAALLQDFNIGVLSSESESLSNSLIEYMVSGLPIVCTDVGGNREIVVDKQNGFVVPPKDHREMANGILKIIGDPALAQNIRLRNFERAKMLFALNVMKQAYQDLYQRLIKS